MCKYGSSILLCKVSSSILAGVIYYNNFINDDDKLEDINEEGTYEVYGGNGFLGFTEDYNVTNDTLIIGLVGAKCGNVHLVCDHKWVTDNALIAKTNQNYRFLFFLLTSMRLNNLANHFIVVMYRDLW